MALRGKVVIDSLVPDGPTRTEILGMLKQHEGFIRQCPLPTLTLCIRRFVALRSPAGDWPRHFHELEDFVTELIEQTFLGDSLSDHWLFTDPPDGAQVRYTWGKDRFTLADPRAQAPRTKFEPHSSQHIIGRGKGVNFLWTPH